MVAGLAGVLLFLLWQAVVESSQGTVSGAIDGVVNLSPGLQNQTLYYQIYWCYESSQKIAIQKSSGAPHYPDSTFRGRLQLFPNYTLQISYLQKSDSGTYWVYLEDKAGKEHGESIRLTVHEQVPKPMVRAEVRGDAEQCEVTLICSVELKDVTYEWILPHKLLEHSQGPQLNLSFNPWAETYTCRASNPVSSSTASLTYRQPCSWEAEPSATSLSVAQKTKVLMALAFLLLHVMA
ncbi:CD48 antigen-like isoform X2 [Struthio camelus]|uniref:CD48 antigen-like isoform X2 n=1 Tax=Struthio camelus TaxID=8801 RepID=UPI0024011C2C